MALIYAKWKIPYKWNGKIKMMKRLVHGSSEFNTILSCLDDQVLAAGVYLLCEIYRALYVRRVYGSLFSSHSFYDVHDRVFATLYLHI